MINAIVKGLLSLFLAFANVIIGPILTLISGFFVNLNLGGVITSCNNILITYIAPSIGWFCGLIPPNTFNIILMEIELTIVFYTFYIFSGFILDILHLVKKVPLA